MMLFAILAAAATSAASAHPAPPPRRPALEQATATVRIVAGARIGDGKLPEEAIVTPTVVRDSDGTQRRVRLVEFP